VCAVFGVSVPCKQLAVYHFVVETGVNDSAAVVWDTAIAAAAAAETLDSWQHVYVSVCNAIFLTMPYRRVDRGPHACLRRSLITLEQLVPCIQFTLSCGTKLEEMNLSFEPA